MSISLVYNKTIVVPKEERQNVINAYHEGHFSINTAFIT